MKYIHLPHSNSTLLMFNKGGSTLFSATFKLFCDWKGIQMTTDFDDLKRSKIIVISRNPVDRFYSGFLHWVNLNSGERGFQFSSWDRNKNIEHQLVEKLDTFIEDCENGKIELDGDYHYVRQKTILEQCEIQTPILHQIEYLHPQIEESGFWNGISSNLNFKKHISLVDNQKLIDNVPIFNQLDIKLEGWDGHFFCSTYHLMVRNLKDGHHRGDSKRLRLLIMGHYPTLETRIVKWLKDDSKMFGYEE